jgi:hypothetical protein
MRAARHHAGLSQLELRVVVSQRHIAFVEGGKSRHSRNLLVAWMSHANASPWLRNAASHQAGFVPSLHAHGNINTAEFQDAEAILRLQQPNPAIISSSNWRIVTMNGSARWLWSIVMPGMVDTAETASADIDMIAAVLNEDGLLSKMINPEAFSAAMLAHC